MKTNSFNTYICLDCKTKFGIPLMAIPEVGEKCLNCGSKNIKKAGTYNPNDPNYKTRIKNGFIHLIKRTPSVQGTSG